MKILVIDDDKRSVADYIEAIKKEEKDVVVRGFTVSPEYSSIVWKELSRLRFPILIEEKRIHVKTFGKFEVYIDGIPVISKYNKTRELFAYLVDKNGALSSTNEIMEALWDSDAGDHVSYMKNIRADMIATLKKFGVEDVLVRQRGRLGIIPDMIDCDFYDMLSGDEEAIKKYAGSYMSQYSWAEYTNAILAEIKAEAMGEV